MTKTWVINSSPIIILGKLNKLDLISSINKSFIIPQFVYNEIIQGPNDDEAKCWINSKGKKYVKDTGKINDIVSFWDLGLGESSVISHCYKKENYYAIIDDYAARKCAETLSIKVKGTLGILLIAKKNRLIKNIKCLLDEMKEQEFRIDDILYKSILKLANEKQN
jgi:predicted nucleic acid-binding protein